MVQNPKLKFPLEQLSKISQHSICRYYYAAYGMDDLHHSSGIILCYMIWVTKGGQSMRRKHCLYWVLNSAQCKRVSKRGPNSLPSLSILVPVFFTHQGSHVLITLCSYLLKTLFPSYGLIAFTLWEIFTILKRGSWVKPSEFQSGKFSKTIKMQSEIIQMAAGGAKGRRV